VLTVLSPAKTLDYETPSTTATSTTPRFMDQSALLVDDARKLAPDDIRSLMGVSESIADLNHARFMNWQEEASADNAKQAVLAFKGDVYTGLEADSMSESDLEFAQSRLRILSGLYGLLRPLDLMQPYRLEMGTKLSVGNSTDLYQFWKKKVTDKLENELERNELLVNLASKEYFSVVDAKFIKSPIVSPEFKDFKNGKLKIISFYAKKARGMMARYLIEKNAKSLDDINSFEISGYRLSNEETINKFNPVFIR